MRKTTRHAATGLALAALMCATLTLPAAAAPKHLGKAGAQAAIANVHALGKGKGVRTGFELTPALAQLSASLPSLTGSDRDQGESLLARPDDKQQDPADTHKWTVPEAPGSPYCLAHFCVHWVAASADAPALTNSNLDPAPDYVEQMAAILENEVFPCENGTGPTACAGGPGLGWREPAPDGGRGSNDKTDVYVEDLFTNEHVFGYVATDPGQPQDPSVPHFAYMVMDKDYSRYAKGDPAGGLAAERVTAAHEYNHVLQNAYDYLEDSWMFEATAVYMEEKVYPENNDYLDYVRAWASNTKQPLTSFSEGNLKVYGSAVWNHWLDHRYGAGAVRSAWEHSVGAADFAPGAYGAAITGANGAGFSDEFDLFSAAVAEWNVAGSGFPDPYPDVPRDGTLPAGSQTTPFALPHTTFALFDVPIPQTAAPVIRLTAILPPDTAGAVALVGREGADPSAGTVTSNLTPIPAGGIGAVNLNSPGSFGRITAVVVNSDPSKSGFDFKADDYVFTKDAQGVVASVAEPGPPIVTSGGPGAVTDHGAPVGGAVDPHLIETTWTVEYGRTTGYGSSTAPQTVPASTVGAAPVVAPLRNLKARATYHYRVVASNSAGVTAGRDMTFRTLRDVTPPVVTLKVKRQRLATVERRGLLYLARCSERCHGTAELKLGRTFLGKTSLKLAALSHSNALHIRLFPRSRARLSQGRRRVRLMVFLNVADDSRNRHTARRKVYVLP